MSTTGEQAAHAPEFAGDNAATDEHARQDDGAPAAPPAAAAPSAEGGNIDKIREILFGGQMQDYERRFGRLEERLAKEAAELRADTRRRFDALEAFIKQELEALGERLRGEQRGREANVQELRTALAESGQGFDRKLAQLDEQTERAQRDLRQQLLEQAKTLGDDLRQQRDDLVARIEREVAALGHDKTDRAALAALFGEVALRLTNEFRIPGDNS
ncbi:MAG TPA: hypothetical protein VF546_08395 [Pyrinomonadaceae bacterium]|jgi:hypothetical protein